MPLPDLDLFFTRTPTSKARRRQGEGRGTTLSAVQLRAGAGVPAQVWIEWFQASGARRGHGEHKGWLGVALVRGTDGWPSKAVNTGPAGQVRIKARGKNTDCARKWSCNRIVLPQIDAAVVPDICYRKLPPLAAGRASIRREIPLDIILAPLLCPAAGKVLFVRPAFSDGQERLRLRARQRPQFGLS